MTRFARAKGAAASNERVEEEATPWHQMVRGIRSANGFKDGRGDRDVEDLDGGLEVLDAEESQTNLTAPERTSHLDTYQEESNSSDDDGEYDPQVKLIAIENKNGNISFRTFFYLS